MVDAQLGPYLEVAEAVLAAGDGDLILVGAGSYLPFDVGNKQLSIFGSSCVVVSGKIRVTGLGLGRRVAIAQLEADSLEVTGCLGNVLASQMVLTTASVVDSADVRLHACNVNARKAIYETGRDALAVSNSNVEVSDSYLAGDSQSWIYGGPGGAGLRGSQASELVVSNTDIYGGDSSTDFDPYSCGSYGGNAVNLYGGSQVLLIGLQSLVCGGYDYFDCPQYGQGYLDGHSIYADSSSSAVYFGYGTCGVEFGAVTYSQSNLPDLELLNGSSPTFRIHGEPGSRGRLRLGLEPIKVPSGLLVDNLVLPLRSFPFGPIPAAGYLDLTLDELDSYPQGTLFFLQSLLLPASGEAQLSNSVSYKQPPELDVCNG